MKITIDGVSKEAAEGAAVRPSMGFVKAIRDSAI
jgi:hypothetical protein